MIAPTLDRRRVSVEEDRFRDLLDLWVEWMTKRSGLGRAPSRGAVVGRSESNYRAAEDDADAAYDKRRLLPALAFDACVESLYAHERRAIYKAQELTTIYDFDWIPFEQALAEGMQRLRRLVAQRC